MLQELRGIAEARTTLLSMLRLARFNRLDLAHVCCRHPYRMPSSRPKPLPQEDAREIIDEEEEIIANLEAQMADLS
jgi:hypothetical protein